MSDVEHPAPMIAPHCPLCSKLIALDEHGMIRVHFERATDARACDGSYRNLLSGKKTGKAEGGWSSVPGLRLAPGKK